MLSLYFIFSPVEHGWMPRCSFKVLTGYSCPGCGAQRAFHAALHGNFQEALGYNFFLVIGIPYLLLAVIAKYIPSKVGTWVDTHLLNIRSAWIYTILFFAWWIIRNILEI